MDDHMGDAPITCPDPARWLDIAAGAESLETSTRLAEHAANCGECASQLREALQILAEDAEDPVENRFLATLKSSQAGWQKELAQRLSRYPSPPRDEPRAYRTTWWTWRLAGVFAAAALALVFVSLAIVRSRHLSPRLADLAQRGAPTSSTGAPSPASSDASKAPREPAPVQLLVASLVLEPGTTRALGRPALLKLSPATQSVAVTLLFLDAPPRKLSLKLLDFADREKWIEDMEMMGRDVNRRQVTVKIPAKGLAAGDYRIFAGHVTVGETERVSEYAFRIIR